MKILLHPYQEGSGISTYILDLAKHLSLSHEVICIGNKPSGHFKVYPLPKSSFQFLGKYAQVPPFSWVDSFTYGRKLSAIVASVTPDIVHTSDHIPGLNVSCPVVTVAWDYPKSLSGCFKLARRYSSPLMLPYRVIREIEMSLKDFFAYRKSSRLFALTGHVFGKLKTAGYPVVQIPYGITIRDIAYEKYDKMTIAFMGRHHIWTPRKGLKLLFDALLLVKKTHPDLSFDLKLIGEVPAGFDAVMKKYSILKPHISVMGLVTREKSLEVIQRAHIFAAPSLYDEWAVGVEEALMYGTPLIASNDNHSFVEMVGNEGGVLTDIHSPQKFAADLLRLLTDRELLGRLSEGARRRVKEKFSWDVLVPKMVEEYGKLLQ